MARVAILAVRASVGKVNGVLMLLVNSGFPDDSVEALEATMKVILSVVLGQLIGLAAESKFSLAL